MRASERGRHIDWKVGMTMSRHPAEQDCTRERGGEGSYHSNERWKDNRAMTAVPDGRGETERERQRQD